MIKLIRGLHNIKKEHHGCVATIGNFDGVHVGHQVLLTRLVRQAKQLKLPATVITFEPQPREYFSHSPLPSRLMRLREKLIYLNKCAVDRLVCLSFNENLAMMNADNFVQDILLDKLGIHYLLVGEDFRFGHNRTGDINLLRQLAADKQSVVEVVNPVRYEDQHISSTLIRNALQQGDLQAAAQYLGHPYSMCGRVVHGEKRGRQLGVPTANVFLHRQVTPVQGVFAVDIVGLSKKPKHGVANIGQRPTVGGSKSLLEVHMFDFSEMIYGRHIEVIFRKKLRDEQRFADFAALKEQIFNDIECAREFFSAKA